MTALLSTSRATQIVSESVIAEPRKTMNWLGCKNFGVIRMLTDCPQNMTPS